MLDLGGGSTQIALAVEDDHNKQINVDGDKNNLFAYSHLGFGLMAARAAVITFNVPSSKLSESSELELVHSCFAPGVTVKYKYGDKSYTATGNVNHSFTACVAITDGMINHPSSSFNSTKNRPAISSSQPVYALSYYRDRAVDLGMIDEETEHGVVTLHGFIEAANDVCGKNPIEIRAKYPRVSESLAPFFCLDLCYIVSLLDDGFKIHPKAPLNLARKIEFNGEKVETSWSLGASLLYLTDAM